MDLIKRPIKSIIRTFSPGLQQKLRQFYLTRRVLNDQGPREPEMAALKALVRGGDSAADLGANLGVYTKELAHLVGPSGRVYSFEPLNENYQILETVRRAGRLSNVQLFQAAIGSRAGKRQMVVPDLGGFTGYYQAHFSRDQEIGKLEVVEVLTLDELWRTDVIPHLDLIKCDVEGAELEVVEGGLSMIKAQLPACLMEVSRVASHAVFQTFHNLGYRAFVYRSHLIQTASYQDKQFSNYFFLHPESTTWKRALPDAAAEFGYSLTDL